MKIDERKFPILGCITNNRLTEKVFEMLDNSGYDDKGIAGIKPSFNFFFGKQLQINYNFINHSRQTCGHFKFCQGKVAIEKL